MTTSSTQPTNQPISQTIKYITIAVAFIATVITLIMNITIRDGLFKQGVNFIYSYQSNSPSNFVIAVHNLISLLGNTIFVIVYLVLLYLISYRKLSVIVYLTYCMVNIYFMVILKQLFQEPRPYWYSQSIKQLQWNCERQYGHPSGHSWISVLFYEPLITDFMGKGMYNLGLILPLLSGALIPLSRMYLGSHSSNQIIMGLLYSMIFIVLYRYLFHEKLYSLYCLLMSKASILLMTLIILLNLLLLIVPIIIYSTNISSRKIDQLYIDRINRICSNNESYQHIQRSIIESCAIINLVFGFFYASILLKKNKYALYFTGGWKYTSAKNVFMKLLLYIVTCGIPAIIFLLTIPKFTNSAIGSYISQSIGYLLIGINFIGLVPYLSIRWQVVKLGDKEGQIQLSSVNEQN